MNNGPSALPIQYSCYFSRSRTGEQFVPEHTLSFVVSGSVEMADVGNSLVFRQGTVYFCRRNRLVKYVKQPPEGGEFRSVSVYFDQQLLRRFYTQHQQTIIASVEPASPAFVSLKGQPVLAHYMESLRAYESLFSSGQDDGLVTTKQEEALLLLLRLQPGLKNILFDFSEPGKIDIEAFMNRNFHFNVGLSRFAYLTGRSLSGFKRDFEKVFHDTPSHWLTDRRLKEAHYLIREQGRPPSDVYLDLGFEDLSHFSFAFKKKYGVAPSMVTRHP